MNKKTLSTIIAAAMAVAGALGYHGNELSQSDHPVSVQQIQHLEQRLERVEGRTLKALESIDRRLTNLEGR
jgi:hypothetical protein